MLTGNNIYKSYGENNILQDVCIDINPGKFTILVGPSGCGKTTLIKNLALIENPDKGVVKIDDAVYNFPTRENFNPWPDITVVFQQQFLWPHLTLQENILFPISSNPNKIELFEEMVEIFDMSDFIYRHPNEASLGQRQRVAIARALVLNPKYILLDEITTALDIEQTNILLNHLLKLSERGIGMLLVTHYYEFSKKLLSKGRGDMIAFMFEGQIEEVGGIEIYSNPKSEKIKRFMNSVNL